jgi:hypothetical protein
MQQEGWNFLEDNIPRLREESCFFDAPNPLRWEIPVVHEGRSLLVSINLQKLPLNSLK